MICLNCGAVKTKVINSRENTKTIRVWRRRRCEICKSTFTTSERPELESLYRVAGADRKSVVFSEARLAMSILEVMSYSAHEPTETSFWLTRSVIDRIVSLYRPAEPLESAAIAALVYETLAAYDKVASLAYASRHGIEF